MKIEYDPIIIKLIAKEVVKELQLYPQRDGVDGFYLTLLQKEK